MKGSGDIAGVIRDVVGEIERSSLLAELAGGKVWRLWICPLCTAEKRAPVQQTCTRCLNDKGRPWVAMIQVRGGVA